MASSAPLDGRVAVVAGATGPIGKAVCASLAEAGASVAIHFHRHREAATAVADALTGEHLTVGGDLRDRATVGAVFDEVEARLGAPTVLVNAAHPAVIEPRPVASIDGPLLHEQLGAVELHAALCARAIPAMRAVGWGRIVYVSGALMARPARGFGAYGAAKAAATVLTRYVALEEGKSGITANIVAPGRVVDPSDDEPTGERAELARLLRERLALEEFPTPHEVAAVVTMLVGDTGDAITGQTIWVTGGEPISG